MTVNQALNAAWNVHDNTDDHKVKIMAINTIRKCGETKFSLFQGGPGMMEIGRLSDRVRELGDNMKLDRANNEYFSVNARRLNDINNDNNDRWRS